MIVLCLFTFHFPFLICTLQSGGSESGLRKKQEDIWTIRLYQVKGLNNPRVALVETSVNSLNSGDVFILDNNDVIYQWVGKESNMAERGKAIELCTKLKTQDETRFATSCKIVIVEEEEEDDEFWTALGCDPADVKIRSAEEGGDDKLAEEEEIMDVYEIEDESKSETAAETGNENEAKNETAAETEATSSSNLAIRRVEKSSGNFYRRSQLRNDCTYLVDCEFEIHIWVGQLASPRTKSTAILMAQHSMNEYDRPEWVPITVMYQDHETPLFKAKFKSWTIDSSLPDYRAGKPVVNEEAEFRYDYPITDMGDFLREQEGKKIEYEKSGKKIAINEIQEKKKISDIQRSNNKYKKTLKQSRVTGQTDSNTLKKDTR